MNFNNFQIPFKDERLRQHSAAIILCLIYTLIWCFILAKKYFSFGYYDWDLAFFTQAAGNLLRGEQFTSLVGINYFGDHSYFFTFFILPIFALFQSPLTLIYLKVFAFSFSGFILYIIAREQLSTIPSLYVLILYFLFPGNIFGLIYEFNPEAFAPPLIFLAWRAAKKGRFVQFIVWATLLASVKENMFLIAAMLSLFGFFTCRKNNRLPWALATIGFISIFFVLILKLIPLWRGLPQHAFMVRYLNLGHNIPDILFSPILHWENFLKIIFSPLNQNYLLNLFDYLLFPVLLSITTFLPAVPLLIQHLLSTHPPEHTIFYHYIPTIAPFIFLALIKTLSKINREVFSRYSKIICGGFFLLAILSLMSYTEHLQDRLNFSSIEKAALRWQLVKQIPPDAAVIATFNYLAPLSTRAHLYSFHKIYDDAYQNPERIKRSELNTKTNFELPHNVKYAILDLDDTWLVDAIKNNEEAKRRVDRFFKENHWRVIEKSGKTILLTR